MRHWRPSATAILTAMITPRRPRKTASSPYRAGAGGAKAKKAQKNDDNGDNAAVLPDLEDLPPAPALLPPSPTSLPMPSVSPSSSPIARKRKRGGESSSSAPAVGKDAVAPPNWERMYALVKDMRDKNPTAPVDTMGCAELYSKSSSHRDQRYHKLVALMLSSQTKDAVTAAAMQRLHTELGPCCDTAKTEEDYDGVTKEETRYCEASKASEASAPQSRRCHPSTSTLTLENMLAVPHNHLNSLIAAVGFHNNKTKYLKQTALILRDSYASDIPCTAAELATLPGVGPKMAHLCMTAAWGITEGIGVDVHVHRITNLWGWHNTRTPEETRRALEAWLPREKWWEINKLLVGLGQTVCLPGSNSRRRCQDCALGGTGLCNGETTAKKTDRKEGKKR